MRPHYCVPPFVPFSLSSLVQDNREIRDNKLRELWGYLLSTSTAVSIQDIRDATSERVGLSSLQSFHLYLRVMASIGMAVSLNATEGVRRRSFAGSFPRDLPATDRRLFAEWVDGLVCERCVAHVRTRFLGGCPVRWADQRELPILPRCAVADLHMLDRLYEPKTRALWGEMVTFDGVLTRAELTELSATRLDIKSSQTVGRYLRAMERVGLIKMTAYRQGVGKIYEGCFPARTVPRDIDRLEPWLRTLSPRQYELVMARAAQVGATHLLAI